MSARAWILTLVVVTTNVAGNLLLTLGVKGTSLVLIGAGVAVLILWTFSRMALLSWADLSFVLPVTSAGYILTALAGKYVLAEHISAPRWFGTALIFLGMVIVSRTPAKTRA
jgi:uncharacterized membrane protein